MNRIIQTSLLVLILSNPAICQEPDTLGLSNQRDTIEYLRETGEFLPLWEPDTVYTIQGTDTVTQYQPAVIVQADSLVVAEPDFTHSASKATMYALVVPGLGQAYNRKYWKMPIVWAAFGVAGYAISYNSRNYKLASEEYALLPDDTNERILQFWRRNMEISYIAMLAVYALQVLDAYVDAQLYSWDVNDNLSLRVAPSLQPLLTPASKTGQAYGLTCRFNLKRQ